MNAFCASAEGKEAGGENVYSAKSQGGDKE